MRETHTTSEGEMLDAIVYRHYGYLPVAFEGVMAANPHIKEMREHLKAGVVITFPDVAEPNTSRMKRVWDLT